MEPSRMKTSTEVPMIPTGMIDDELPVNYEQGDVMNATATMAAQSSGTPFESRIAATASPENCLPPELIIKILDSGESIGWKQLVNLSHICHHWREALLGNPAAKFWAHAYSELLILNRYVKKAENGTKDRLQTMLLKRSKEYPIRLTVNDHCYNTFVSRLHEVQDSTGIFSPNPSPESCNKLWAPQLTQLTLNMNTIEKIASTLSILSVISEFLVNLEILRIPDEVVDFDPLADLPSVSFPDSSFPRLHTLSISGRLFTRDVALESLKTIDLHDDSWNPDVIVDALKECASSLESLTLRQEWTMYPKDDPENEEGGTGSGEDGEPLDIVHLPQLRHLKIIGTAPACILGRLSYPSDVTIHIDWSPMRRHKAGKPLLPGLVGLHPPGPFFDSLCLSFFSESWGTPTLHCSLHGVDHLRVEGWHKWSENLPTRGSGFLDERRSEAVTELAIDVVDTYKNGDKPNVTLDAGAVQTFVRRFTNLRHLTVLASLDGNVQIEATAGFLDLLTGTWQSDSASSLGDRCLTYVCVLRVMERPIFRDLEDRNLSWIELFDREIMPKFDAELNRLNRLLEDRLAEHHQLLSRLELCCLRVPRAYHSDRLPPPRDPYRNFSDIPLSFVYPVKKLEDKYSKMFQRFTREVVFIGPGDHS